MLPFSEVNLVAVLVATIASMFLGMIWFGPLFGKPWMKLVGLSKSDGKDGMGKAILLGFISSFVMFFSVGLLLILSNPATIQEALWHGALIAIGFKGTTEASSVIWAKSPTKLAWINVGYELTAILIGVLILVNWPT